MKIEGFATYPYPLIIQTLKENFDTIGDSHIVDDIPQFKGELFVTVNLRGKAPMRFNMIFRAHAVSSKTAKLYYRIDFTSVYIFSLLMWLFISAFAFLAYPNWIAIIFGIPGALLIYFPIRSSVSRALVKFESRLKKLSPASR